MSLNDTLQKLKETSRARIPKETAAIMTQATEQLQTSGILKGILGQGHKAPEFELPDSGGHSYSSAGLLAKGPLILHFYRGPW